MNIYFYNMLFTAIWGLIFLILIGGKKGKISFCVLTSIQWILISGLRGMSSSADMHSYLIRFERVKNTSWSDIFDKFYFVYVGGEGKDPGYDVFEKIVQLFTDSYQVYLFVVAIIFFVAMGIWVFKNSLYPMLSMFIFDAFLYSFFALTGIRQTLATVLVVFLGSKFIKERKLPQFIIIALVAYTIHKSSICFFPFYFISLIPVSKKYIAGVLTAFPLLFIFREPFFYMIGGLVGYEYAELESTGAYTFTALYLVIVVASLFLFNYIKKICENYNLYFNAMFMGLLLIPLVFVNPAAMRAVQYYSLYLMIFIPKIVKSFEKKFRMPVYTAMIVTLLIATSAFSRTDYTFFWQ